MEDDHTYFAGQAAGGAWVHNVCDVKWLAKLLGISEDAYHGKYKKKIMQRYKAQLKKLGVDNPDINVDNNGMVQLIDPRNKNGSIDTGDSIDSLKAYLGLE